MFRRFSSQFLGMNSGVVYQEKAAYVIDPGVFPQEIKKIKDFLEKENIAKITVLLTHTHPDHISGWFAFKNYPTYGHKCISRKSSEVRENDVRFLKGMYRKQGIEDTSNLVFPEPIIYLDDGIKKEILPFSFIFYHVPGHSPDMSAIVIPEEKMLFSGDMLIQGSTPFILHSTRLYWKSLQRIQDLVEQYDLQCLIPGHGKPARSGQEIMERVEHEKKYLKNLVWEGLKLAQAGLDKSEIKSRLINYNTHFARTHAHQANVQTFLREIEEWLDEEIIVL